MHLEARSIAPLACAIVAACGEQPPAFHPVPEAEAVAPAASTSTRRIVALGDLHGDPRQALAALTLAGIVDDAGRWAGGTAILVQTGDTTDRGPDSKGAMDLLRRLETEAAPAGGQVVALLGNHEVMNIRGDLRYVSAADTAGFGGVDARKAAFAADGEYGRWLAGRDAVARIDDTVFVHGGITPSWAEQGIAAMNDAVHEAMWGSGSAAVLGPDGPLWYRGLADGPEVHACPELTRSLHALGARRMVVGHTRREDGRIATRCDGRLIVIDVGLSAFYDGGHLAVLDLTNGDATAITPTGVDDLEDPP
jgi:hypothetical protein